MAFDILYLDKFSFLDQPQKIRKELLSQFFKNIKSDVLKLTEEYDLNSELLNDLCKQNQEGLILKNPEAPYEQKRSSNWLKLKCGHREEYLVIGWTDPQGTRSYFGSLLLAEDVDGELQYRGRVGTGFDEEKLKDIFNKLSKIKSETNPVNLKRIPGVKAHFVKPHYYAEVQFTEKSTENRLRHPVFLGLREDKFFKASEQNLMKKKVMKTKAVSEDKSKSKSKSKSKKISNIILPNTTVKLSHPDKILFQDIKFTKKDLLNYYALVFNEFKKMGLHRPLSYLRCPQGTESKCFFQKHLDPENGHPPQVKIKTSSSKMYSYFENFDDLASLIQLSTLEFHGWNCSVENTDKPQFVVWDIDPGPGVDFSFVTQTAHIINLILEQKGYQTFVRTTGGKGLHVLTLVKNLSWEDAKSFSLEIGKLVSETKPDAYVLKSSLKIRKNKIFIDYLRNSKAATSILNYSTRARKGAPISVPLDWSEVHEKLNPQDFNVNTIQARLDVMNEDPWKDFYKNFIKS